MISLGAKAKRIKRFEVDCSYTSAELKAFQDHTPHHHCYPERLTATLLNNHQWRGQRSERAHNAQITCWDAREDPDAAEAQSQYLNIRCDVSIKTSTAESSRSRSFPPHMPLFTTTDAGCLTQLDSSKERNHWKYSSFHWEQMFSSWLFTFPSNTGTDLLPLQTCQLMKQQNGVSI